MFNPIFVNLLRLYSSYSQKTPVEDFTTEVLAGVLQSDPTLLTNFVNQVLEIEGDGFTVTTQVSFSNARIDMVFTNNTTVCFLENNLLIS